MNLESPLWRQCYLHLRWYFFAHGPMACGLIDGQIWLPSTQYPSPTHPMEQVYGLFQPPPPPSPLDSTRFKNTQNTLLTTTNQPTHSSNRSYWPPRPPRPPGVSEGEKTILLFWKSFFQWAWRIILGPLKHVLLLVWSHFVIFTAAIGIRTVLKATRGAQVLGEKDQYQQTNKSKFALESSETNCFTH